jgi:hypothetical protein
MTTSAIPAAPQSGPPSRPNLQEIIGYVRRFIPFASAFAAGGKSGRGQWVTVQFGTANVDVSVSIALGHIPTGYIPVGQNKSGSVYDGSNARADWTASKIVLRCDDLSAKVNLWVF